MNWSEWLTRGLPFGMDQIESTPTLLAVALIGSLISSFLVSFLYVRFTVVGRPVARFTDRSS